MIVVNKIIILEDSDSVSYFYRCVIDLIKIKYNVSTC